MCKKQKVHCCSFLNDIKIDDHDNESSHLVITLRHDKKSRSWRQKTGSIREFSHDLWSRWKTRKILFSNKTRNFSGSHHFLFFLFSSFYSRFDRLSISESNTFTKTSKNQPETGFLGSRRTKSKNSG